MKRIIVIGSIASGKTYLAKIISEKFSIPYTDIDDLYWLPGWTRRPKDELYELARQAVSDQKWVLSGNNSGIRSMIFANADTVIWMDIPFRICLWRCFKRAIGNLVNHDELCNGNYESLGRLFFSRYSILLWLVTTYAKRKKTCLEIMRNPEYKHINFIRLRNDHEVAEFVRSLR